MTGTDPSSGDHETVRIPAGFAKAALTRYRMRAAAHRIVADCERLLGEVDGAGRDAWRDAVGKALLSGQQMRSAIERWDPGKPGTAAAGIPDTLLASLRAPREVVVDAMSSLLARIPTDPEEELVLEDARSVREAAIGLFSGDGAPRPSGAVTTAATRAQATPGETASVLVVDDEDALRRVLATVLQRLGYAVTQAPNGLEALAMAERDLPDLVITDLSMPEMTGHELLSRLKSGEATRHIPVIVVSGEGDAASVVKCLEQGAEDHVTKPYERVVLQARIRATLERKRMRDLELTHLRRVAQLTSAAEAVERQTYSSRILADLASQDDQLGQLARVFDRMVNGMRTREEQLESRLGELRREVEHVSGSMPASSLSPEESTFTGGQVIAGRYEIVKALGMGGMGMVYLARDRELAEDVAVKVVRRDVIGQDPSLLDRLKSEMRLARRISHRNVVRSHDLGEWQGIYFLTMEYIKGVTVADLIAKRGRLGVESTLAIATQLADALGVAHGAGIIHRDIKPQNLLVDESGVLKVMDFGLARPVQGAVHFTQAGYIVGTPSYMAPEQLVGGVVDARTDLFATGVVLYECLTGAIPFESTNPMGMIARIMEGSPTPVRDVVPNVPAPLASAVERLLRRDPGERFQSARELGDQLALHT